MDEEIVVCPSLEKHLGTVKLLITIEPMIGFVWSGPPSSYKTFIYVMKEFLYKLEGLSAGTAKYDGTVKQVVDHLRPHNDSEEANDPQSLNLDSAPN